MKKFVKCLHLEANNKFGCPRITERTDYIDVESEDFKRRFRGNLFGIGETEEAAIKDAENKLERYQRILQNEFGKDLII